MRLIDADALEVIFDREDWGTPDERYMPESSIGRWIDDAPTIDAVPVVRCKDCVYRPCKQMPYSYDHDYCSYGERKDNAPTIDPVKHGKWIERKVTHEDNRRSTIIADWQSAKCSNCGKYHTTPYLYYFFNDNYCPNCGATMERSEDETD